MKTLLRTSILYMVLGCFFSAGTQAVAQDSIPREYTNPDEVISFDRQTSFQDAIEILGQYSQEYEQRFIIDRTGYGGNIGINLPPVHWKEALAYILRVQNMTAHEEDDFYEILTRAQTLERMEPTNGGPAVAASVVASRATTQTREVRINATFFEGSRRALREIGVDWSTLTNSAPGNISDLVGGDGGGQGSPLPSQFDNRFVSVNAIGAQNVSQSVFNSLINFGEIGAGISVQALFSAFEADNLGEVLATPSVKVMDGEQGRIQVGEDFSIKQRDFAGNVTDEFFSTGTILTVTPHIIEDQDTTFLYLELDVERSSAQPDPVSTVISKEEASTHTLLINGESTVIAGLYRTERSEVRRGVPILKDLPGWFFGLKYIFGFNSTDISQSELIVLIQAELEDTIPQRMARQLQSQRDLLEQQQARHREGIDYLPEGAFTSPLLEEELSAHEPEPDTLAEDPYASVAVTEPTAEPVAFEVERERYEHTLRQAEIQRQDLSRYQGEYRSVEMENLNSDYSNLLFYTIGGSFLVKENAERLFRSLREEGYDAHILFNPNTSFYFVAYAGFESLSEAVAYTREIQNSVQREAWLSTIITEERLEWSLNAAW